MRGGTLALPRDMASHNFLLCHIEMRTAGEWEGVLVAVLVAKVLVITITLTIGFFLYSNQRGLNRLFVHISLLLLEEGWWEYGRSAVSHLWLCRPESAEKLVLMWGCRSCWWKGGWLHLLHLVEGAVVQATCIVIREEWWWSIKGGSGCSCLRKV